MNPQIFKTIESMDLSQRIQTLIDTVAAAEKVTVNELELARERNRSLNEEIHQIETSLSLIEAMSKVLIGPDDKKINF